MNSLLIFGLIMAGFLLVAFLSIKFFFGKSFIFWICIWTVILLSLFGFLMFFSGMNGVKHLYWSVPSIMVVGFLVFYYLNNIIRKPLEKAIHLLEEIAEGNLDIALHQVDKKDELGTLNNSLFQLAEVLRKIISDIRASADSLTSASMEMSAASDQISRGANEQASSIEEVCSTMEEISANIQQNTENAQQTEKVSVEANNSIKDVAEKSKEAIQANQNIADKITVINDIAFQTNLLALNAAVEAARAGDQGKGFAVVAAEVRKLAESSKLAAEQIVSLTHTALKTTQKAGEVMNETIPKIDKTSMLVQEITAASIEQNNGAIQVNNAIQQLNNITQENASSSEELATTAEMLSAQAVQLKELISFFKLSEDGHSSNVSNQHHIFKDDTSRLLNQNFNKKNERLKEEAHDGQFTQY